MFELFRKHKWRFYWSIFGLMIVGLVLLAISFEEKSWLGNALQTIGTISGLYATLLLYLQSKEENDKQFREHLEHLQNLTTKEIDALKIGTERQISTLQELTDVQIKSFQELTEKQIDAIRSATEKQIDALHKSTFEQISSFEKQTNEIANKLSDNSILLAEILGRELEKAISQTTALAEQAEREFIKLHDFQIGRTKEQKAFQIESQKNRIGVIRQWIDYWTAKYNKLRGYFGFNDKLLNG